MLVGVATLPPSFLPSGILHHKQATSAKYFDGECKSNMHT